jgi:SH3 domain-containing YSC84-like protein 1
LNLPRFRNLEEGDMRTRMIAPLMSILAACLIMGSPAGAGEAPEMQKIHDAETVLRASATAPDKGIPRGLLERAECIGVFPGLTKGAFVVGGEFGRGVFTCRRKDGSMGAPAFFTIGGGSFGWQFGGQQADLVLLIMNENGVRHLLQDKFTLGGEAAAVAGPVGRTAQAGTDAQMHAEILSWSRSRGIFLGASIEGSVVKPDRTATQEFYGKPVTANDILIAQSVPAPEAAQSFVKTATQFSKRSS